MVFLNHPSTQNWERKKKITRVEDNTQTRERGELKAHEDVQKSKGQGNMSDANRKEKGSDRWRHCVK